MINFTGHDDQDEVFDLVAEHGATLLMCRVTGENVREVTDVPVDEDPVPRAARALRRAGRDRRAQARASSGS